MVVFYPKEMSKMGRRRWVLGVGYRVLGVGYWVMGAGYFQSDQAFEIYLMLGNCPLGFIWSFFLNLKFLFRTICYWIQKIGIR